MKPTAFLLLCIAAASTAAQGTNPPAKPDSAKTPAVKAPVVKAPAVKAPAVKAPPALAPGAKAPDTRAPSTQAPGAKAPDTKAAAGTKAATSPPAGGAKAPPTKAPAVSATPPQAPAVRTPPIMREVFGYQPENRRDPFFSLLTSSELRPTVQDLQLTSVLYDETGNNSIAVMRDIVTSKQYRVTVGATLGRMRVALIRRRTVIFSIEEFGLNRQDSIVLGDTTKVRAK